MGVGVVNHPQPDPNRKTRIQFNVQYENLTVQGIIISDQLIKQHCTTIL